MLQDPDIVRVGGRRGLDEIVGRRLVPERDGMSDGSSLCRLMMPTIFPRDVDDVWLGRALNQGSESTLPRFVEIQRRE